MDAPEYLICLECETPCYVFDWKDEKVTAAQCVACGEDDVDQFVTDEEMEAMVGGSG